MAQILEFRSGTGLTRSVPLQAAGNCEVIIFPGVRYERWEEPAEHHDDIDRADHSDADHSDAAPSAPRQRRRRSRSKARDVLELPD